MLRRGGLNWKNKLIIVRAPLMCHHFSNVQKKTPSVHTLHYVKIVITAKGVNMELFAT